MDKKRLRAQYEITSFSRKWIIGGLVACAAVAVGIADDNSSSDWPMFGQNVANNASAGDAAISTKNVANLKVKWTFTTGGDVSARAAVVAGVAYFPD
jgi:polyvinyl alcohol dehydrogenase (cytochrome)